MKALLCAVAFVFLANYSFGQKVPQIYQIRADTVRIYNTCDTAEFVLENRTKDTLGFLFNKGKGRTEFRRLGLERIGASQLAIKGQDTIDLGFSSFGDTRYDLLSTNFVTIPSGDSMLFAAWPSRKVVGYDAYSSPDMPALSRQAIQGMGNKTYYNGLVVRDGDSGFDLAVNWDGELNGPNGAFLRTKDDTKLAWSKWRELLFKDYADTTYAPYNTETLQSVTSRGNSTSQDILFEGTPSSSAGLVWHFNTDFWRIFVESPQDTPGGDMIFESTDNDQEGWIFRSNNATTPKQVLNIQPEGTFTYLGNNILHTGNHPAGAAFSPTLTGANVLSGITTNAAGHITALTTRALTLADIGAAPASTSGNYIQNLATATGTQTANFSINGTGFAATSLSSPLMSSNSSSSQLSLVGGATASGSARGGEIDLLSGGFATTPGEILFRTGTGTGGTQQPERMRLTATGNLGIGTTAPGTKLDVYTNSDTYAASFGDAANSNLKIAGTAGGATGYGLIQTFTGGTTTGGVLSLQRSGGNVGIGLTAPTGRLEIANGTSAELQFSGANVANIYQSASAQALYVNSNTGPLYLGANGSGTTHLTVLSNGNVGINNTAPAQKLEVAGGNIRAHGGNVQAGPTDASVLSALTYTTGLGVVGSFTNSPFAIYTNSAEKLRVDAAGNVGIGVTAPTSKLHVAGAGLFTGQVQATSFFQSSLRSLKKDIKPFTASALDIFKKVQVRTFIFKADTTGKTNIGFIADEVPDEMATPQRNGVDQASTVALLVKAVQELTEQNKMLQEKISKLEAKMQEK